MKKNKREREREGEGGGEREKVREREIHTYNFIHTTPHPPATAKYMNNILFDRLPSTSI